MYIGKSMSLNYVTVNLSITDTSSEPVKFSIPLTGMNVGEGLTAQPVDNENAQNEVSLKISP